MPASIEQELNSELLLTKAVLTICTYYQSFDNCSGRRQSQQTCDCSSSVRSLLWTAAAAGAARVVFNCT